MNRPPPWYKQFWPWFLLGILGLSIAVSTTFLVVSITSFDGLVEDNYYKVGKAINERLEQDDRAEELNMVAELRIDDLTGGVVVVLDGEARPERLLLELIFPTQGDRDQRVILEHVRDGHYAGQLPRALQYRWYVHLAPDTSDPEWRLRGEIELPRQAPLTLSADSKSA